LVGIVFFFPNKSARTVFLLIFSAKRVFLSPQISRNSVSACSFSEATASLKKQDETLFQLICGERKTLFQMKKMRSVKLSIVQT